MTPTSNHTTPAYRLVVDGKDITPTVRALLVGLSLTEARGDDADTLDLSLSDHDGALALPPKGAIITLALGWLGQALVDKGTFKVDEVEHGGAPDVLTIRARAADLSAQLRNRRDQSWHAKTLGDIVNTIAQRNSLTPRVAPALASRAIAHIDQTNESDIAFLTRLAQRFDAVATVKAGCLLCLPKGSNTTASGKTLPTITLTRASGDRHSYKTADRDSYTGVVAYWHDGAQANRKSEAVGTRVNAKTLKDTYANAADAQQAAQAAWQRIQRGLATMTLMLAQANPALVPETPARVSGFKREIDGTDWCVVRVSSHLDESGYTQGVEMELGGV
ncbi:MAG: contractile injection system protein, VgrG/Pvc8 family [Hydrogenophaga sp.]|uniref:contractile injection system protein, VgrG/Pvc8 family n=1 Tax=Hydrogenophaga sp. TaxID=1904254 RepID=UPI00271683EB|nr:contractile injection system protein, VgrG/Pvc8 family [Hydrogenophaga sp.]MDO9571165.1 contractile injection system protein, VgrG/Pvc8 family [Hydrogenophaga sp.]